MPVCIMNSIATRLRELFFPFSQALVKHIGTTMSSSGLPSTKEMQMYQMITTEVVGGQAEAHSYRVPEISGSIQPEVKKIKEKDLGSYWYLPLCNGSVQRTPSQNLPRGANQKGERQWAKVAEGKILVKYKKINIFHHKDAQTQQEVSRAAVGSLCFRWSVFTEHCLEKLL